MKFKILRHNSVVAQNVDTIEEVREILAKEKEVCLNLYKEGNFIRNANENIIIVGYIESVKEAKDNDVVNVWIEDMLDSQAHIDEYTEKYPDYELCYITEEELSKYTSIQFRSGYYEWNIIVNGEIVYSIGDSFRDGYEDEEAPYTFHVENCVVDILDNIKNVVDNEREDSSILNRKVLKRVIEEHYDEVKDVMVATWNKYYN